MKKNYCALIITGLLIALAGCSSSPTGEDGQNTDAISPPSGDAATDAVPPADGLTAPSADASAPPPAVDAGLDASAPPPAPLDASAPSPAPMADLASTPTPTPPEPLASAPSSDAVEPSSGNFETYTVQAGDTLMKIAFETYGDLYRWHAILDANRDKISDPNRIPAGTVLKIEKPSTQVSIQRNGERYTIKSGDTLGSISSQVYGTRSRWKEIWENNKQLIKNPNRIFAGFALYYMNGTQNQPTPVADTPEAAPVKAEAPSAAPPMAQAQAAPGTRAPASVEPTSTSSMAVAPVAPPTMAAPAATGDAPVIENAPAGAGQ